MLLHGREFFHSTIFSPFPKQDPVLTCLNTSLLKTLWEKEKLLVMSNFSFSYIVFLTLWRTFCHLDKCKNCHLQTLSSLEESKICRLGKGLPFPKQALVFACLQYKSFENTVGKGEIARNEQFLLFPQCFLPISRTFYHFHQI